MRERETKALIITPSLSETPQRVPRRGTSRSKQTHTALPDVRCRERSRSQSWFRLTSHSCL